MAGSPPARLIARLVPAADAVGLEVADLANVGGPEDYRIPDAVVYRAEAGDHVEPYLTSVELIVEIRSPGKDPVAKLPFYLRQGAREAVLVDPATATVQWLAAQGDEWAAVDHSDVFDIEVAEVVTDLLR